MKEIGVVSGARWSLISNVVQLFFGILTILLITRMLGPSGYGTLETILAIMAITVLVGDFGLSPSVSRFIAKADGKKYLVKTYFSTGLIVKIISMLVSIVVLCITFPFIEEILGISLNQYKLLIFLLIILKLFFDYFGKIYQGIRRLDILSKQNIIKNISHPLIILVLILNGFKIEAYFMSEIAILLFFLFVNIFYVIRNNLLAIQLDRNILKEIIKYALPMFIISLSFLIYMRSDVFMIQYYSNSNQVGYYSLAVMIVMKIQMFFVAIGTAIGPEFARRDKDSRQELFLKVYKIVLMIALPISVGLFLISDSLILVFFGEKFSLSITVLKLYSIFLFFYCSNAVFSPLLDYSGKAKLRSALITFSAIANVLLNVYLIPKFGINGAAFSTLITYTIYGATVNINAVKHNLRRNDLKTLFIYNLKVLFSTTTMVIGILLVKQITTNQYFTLALIILTGIFLYSVTVYSLRLTSVRELKSMIRIKR